MTEYRASFDASVTFANGGGLTAQGFRVDVPAPDVDEAGIAALFVASLGLLMTESVELGNVEVFAEPHKGTRGGPVGPFHRPAGPRRDAGRAQPRDPGRDDHLSRAARAGDHPASDPGSLTRPPEAGAAWLAGQDPALVGIDAVNIDDAADGRRPAHSLLLAAGIPVVEHLTGLGQLPPAGACTQLLQDGAQSRRRAGQVGRQVAVAGDAPVDA